MEQHAATRPGESEEGEDSREDNREDWETALELPNQSSVLYNPLC